MGQNLWHAVGPPTLDVERVFSDRIIVEFRNSAMIRWYVCQPEKTAREIRSQRKSDGKSLTTRSRCRKTGG